MNSEAMRALVKQIAKEKDLDVQVIKKAIEDAVIAASRKVLSQYKEARAELDVETGVLHLWVKKTVVQEVTNPRTMISLRDARKIKKDAQVGDEIEVDEDPSVLGHIAAQNMRQILSQKIQDAEREKICAEWSARVGEVVNAIVQRVERDGSVIVNLGRVEGVLPKREMAPNARYQPNERIKALVVRVDPNARGPMIILSRTVPEFVAKLFEQEVPEIAEGVVRIVKIAREPGVRTKIAVESTSKEIDAVGACVGLKGSRVQMVVRELDNERIDVVAYSPKPEQFVANALTPAEISSVRIIPEENKAIVIVKPNNLSLAIGSRGQNARLAAKLTGMTLDIHAEGEEQMLSKVDPEQINQRYLADLLTQKEIMEEGILEKLAEHGIRSVEDLTKADPYKLSEIFSSDVDWAQELIEDAQSYLEELEDLRKKRFSEQEG